MWRKSFYFINKLAHYHHYPRPESKGFLYGVTVGMLLLWRKYGTEWVEQGSEDRGGTGWKVKWTPQLCTQSLVDESTNSQR